MAFDFLYQLWEESARLCDKLYKQAVLLSDTGGARFERTCEILDRALERQWRRMTLAGI